MPPAAPPPAVPRAVISAILPDPHFAAAVRLRAERVGIAAADELREEQQRLAVHQRNQRLSCSQPGQRLQGAHERLRRLVRTLEALPRLRAGQPLVALMDREPLLLFPQLVSRGYAYTLSSQADGSCEVRIWKDS